MLRKHIRRGTTQRQNTHSCATEEFYARYMAQGGKCAICMKLITFEKSKGLYACVDHCHETGETRGLLCQKCNIGLGYFKDNAGYLTAAAVYLTSYKENSRLWRDLSKMGILPESES